MFLRQLSPWSWLYSCFGIQVKFTSCHWFTHHFFSVQVFLLSVYFLFKTCTFPKHDSACGMILRNAGMSGCCVGGANAGSLKGGVANSDFYRQKQKNVAMAGLDEWAGRRGETWQHNRTWQQTDQSGEDESQYFIHACRCEGQTGGQSGKRWLRIHTENIFLYKEWGHKLMRLSDKIGKECANHMHVGNQLLGNQKTFQEVVSRY